jgi:hypothetical protein
MLGWFNAASTWRFTFEPSEPVGVEGENFGENIQGDVSVQRSVTGSIHFAHSPRTDEVDDFVNAESNAGGKRHRDGG